MVLDIDRAYAHIEHVLFGNVPSGVSKLRLVNEAGEHLCNMHSWWFLERIPATIALVQAQTEYTLPSDFGEWVAHDATNSLIDSLTMVSPGQLLQLETNQLEPIDFGYYGAVFFTTPAGGLVPAATLRIWPPPPAASGSTSSLSIIYRAKWQDMDEDSNTYAQIPPYAEMLYLRVLRAVTLGHVKDQDESPSMDMRLEEIRRGPVFRAAAERDSKQQTPIGPLVNGAIQTIAQGYSSLSRTIVPGPS